MDDVFLILIVVVFQGTHYFVLLQVLFEALLLLQTVEVDWTLDCLYAYTLTFLDVSSIVLSLLLL